MLSGGMVRSLIPSSSSFTLPGMDALSRIVFSISLSLAVELNVRVVRVSSISKVREVVQLLITAITSIDHTSPSFFLLG